MPSPSDAGARQARELIDAGEHEAALACSDSALAARSAQRGRPQSIGWKPWSGSDVRTRHAQCSTTLGPLSLEETQCRALKAELEFAAGPSEDASVLERADRKPIRRISKRACSSRGITHTSTAFEPALQQLIEIVRRDRKFGDDAGRKTMLEIFSLLGAGHPLVDRYRRLLSAALVLITADTRAAARLRSQRSRPAARSAPRCR